MYKKLTPHAQQNLATNSRLHSKTKPQVRFFHHSGNEPREPTLPVQGFKPAAGRLQNTLTTN